MGVVREEVNLSTADVKDLNKNPYIREIPGLAVRIKTDRERRGTEYHSWEQLPCEEGVREKLKADGKWLKLHS